MGDKATAQVIWDRDHGGSHEGWYVRFMREDGQEIDSPCNSDIAGLDDEELRELAQEASLWEGLKIMGEIGITR